MNQDELDWKIFAEEFKNSEGFDPNPNDARASELFRWFTFGAMNEHVGRLNLPKNSNEARAIRNSQTKGAASG